MELLFKVEDFPILQDPLKGVPNKNSRRYKELRDNINMPYVYTWHLKHYRGGWYHNEGTIDWQPDLKNFPSAGIITSEEFIRNLNEWKCFGDMDYLPVEGDCVTIKYCAVQLSYASTPDRPNLWTDSWMQAIFRDRKWARERYYHEILDLVAEGIVYIK